MGRRWAALALGVAVAACARAPRGPRPVVTTAATSEAQVAFAPIRALWPDRTKMPLEELRLRVVTFTARFPKDPLAPLAHVYLALGYLEAGDLVRGKAELPPLEAFPPGDTRDLATMAHAKAQRMSGDAAGAFELLRPLVGKVVDAQARVLFGEEIGRASVALHRDYEAIAYMDAWLRSVDEDQREGVRRKAAEILEEVSPAALQGALQAVRVRGGAVGYSSDTVKLLVDRLGSVAIARQDSALARWLFTSSGNAAYARNSASGGEALTELASSRRGLDEVVARTLGLVLPTSEPSLQDEAAEVVRGVAWAIGLSRAGDDDMRLVTREAPPDAARVTARLDELAGEGAAVVVTGLDPVSADAGLRWAESHKVPVIVLAQPKSAAPGRYGFVVGESTERQLELLGAALRARKVTKVAVIREREEDLTKEDVSALGGFDFGTAAACGGSPELLVGARYPVAEWRKERVQAFLFDAPVDCAFGLGRVVRGEGAQGRWAALTLQASVAAERPGSLSLLTMVAGFIPRLASEKGPDPLADVVARLGRRPDYFTGLGHDAAALAAVAIGGLPMDRTSAPDVVGARRDLARAALERARVKLWTSEEPGFAADHHLHRTLKVVEVPARGR